ncbi:MAG: hypothetical protein IAE93_07685 [Ignavibacteria bacterium]|nr:hypothetical protein [Ignavibacteria bacterium]
MKAILVSILPALITLQLLTVNIKSQTSTGYDSKFVNQSIPDRMIPGQKYNLIVTFQNSGTVSWVPGEVRLKLFSNEDSKSPVWAVSELDLTKTIESENTATFEITVTAPSTAGVYKISAQLTNSAGVFGDVSKILEISVNNEVGFNDALNSSAFVEQTVPSEMEAGKSYKVMVSYTNTGKTSWDKGNYRLIMLDAAGNPLTGNFWNSYSVSLDETISPGGSKVFNFDVVPYSPGTYTLQWRLASGEMGLFGDVSNPAVVTVTPVPEIKNEGKSGKQ